MHMNVAIHTDEETRAVVSEANGVAWITLSSGTVSVTLHGSGNGLSKSQLADIAQIINAKRDSEALNKHWRTVNAILRGLDEDEATFGEARDTVQMQAVDAVVEIRARREEASVGS